MLNKYYADNRDLVKWGVLIRLAERYKLSRILQLAYLRPSLFGPINLDGKNVELPEQVLSHFRNINSIIACHPAISIEVIDWVFDNRINYHKAVKKYLTENEDNFRLVFLDPDTGLEPFGRADHRHVLNDEAAAIWSHIKPNEILALYQHQTNKAGKPWIEDKRKQLEKAIGAKVFVGQGPEIARDVVILYAVKS